MRGRNGGAQFVAGSRACLARQNRVYRTIDHRIVSYGRLYGITRRWRRVMMCGVAVPGEKHSHGNLMLDLYNAGRQYRQSGDLPRAEAAFRELLSLEPTNAEVWLALGSVCRELGKHDDALNAFQRAVTFDPELAQAHNNLGNVLRELGRTDEAPAEKLGLAAPAAPLAVEVAPGELLDKITILEIKAERISDEAKLRNVHTELQTLRAVQDRHLPRLPALDALTADLKQVNEALWQIEDDIRDEERQEEFGARFIELARSVYRQNDRRAALKRQINELLGSRL
ncbi:MAG TPA: tetratricopeptide repeat protein, partial [Pirellulales bacterium]|nr:tetratricopeptide repeat protein [Pirellulales bacterium]